MTYEDLFWISAQVVCFSLILWGAACAVPGYDSQEEIDGRWLERNVTVQLNVVPHFQEVWYKGHQYVIYARNLDRGMLSHAGHCPGIHLTRIGGEPQL